MTEEVTAFIQYLAELSDQVGAHAGIGGLEVAGSIVSYLAAYPGQVELFLEEGIHAMPPDMPLMGKLTFCGWDGTIHSPDSLHTSLQGGVQ